LKPSDALEAHRDQVRAIIARHPARDLRIFESFVHDRDGEGNDLGLLVDPTRATTLFVIDALGIELSDLQGVEADVLTPNALPDTCRDAVRAELRRELRS
jgi:uncharacterized protein